MKQRILKTKELTVQALKLKTENKSNVEIAKILNVSLATIKRWVNPIKLKDNELVKACIELKKQGLTYEEISLKVNIPKGTIAGWLIPYNLEIEGAEEKCIINAKNASLKMQANKAALRSEAYNKALNEAPEVLKDVLLRDFVNLYVGEGFRRNKHRIAIINSSPDVIFISLMMLEKYFLSADKFIDVEIRVYENSQDEKVLLNYWKNIIGNNDKVKIKTYMHSSRSPDNHNGSNVYGLVTVSINDVYAKQKIDAYMDYVRSEWKNKFEDFYQIKVVKTLSSNTIPR